MAKRPTERDKTIQFQSNVSISLLAENRPVIALYSVCSEPLMINLVHTARHDSTGLAIYLDLGAEKKPLVLSI
jgi:hypothetical protein